MVNYTIVAWQRKKGSLISEAIYAQHVLCSTSARCQKPHGFVSLKVVKKIQNSCSAVYTALHTGSWLVRFSNDNNLGIFLIYQLQFTWLFSRIINLNGTHELVLDCRLLRLPILE